MARIIAITGARGVLGSAIATLARARGMGTALIDFAAGPKSLQDNDALLLWGVDLTSSSQAEVAMRAVAHRFGGIDVLLNIAGGFGWETLEQGSPDAWMSLYRLNVITAACASRAALPYLKASGAGRIVNVGSAAALKSGAGMGPYAAAKCGVHRLTESLAEELKGTSVNVNAVLPSIIDTPTNRTDMPDADFSAWVSPSDLAEVILFLASEQASAINGALLPVVGRV